MSELMTEQNFKDLEVKGYTVVPNVLTPAECDETIGQFKTWLSQFDKDDWPMTMNSLIHGYNAGHMRPTWSVRLKAKRVFKEVWNTDKLLTSFDAVAIGRPPEDGVEPFQEPGKHWLHVDQSALRIGLHAYQGAVYLEESCEDDWTMHLMEGSHVHFNLLFEDNPKARTTSILNGFYPLEKDDVTKMQKLGCVIKRVPVPKGGIVLWDSRVIHANARPLEGRKNPGRWRYVVFVSMTPAIWASKEDINDHKEAYEGPFMTNHWSSEHIRLTRRVIVLFSHEFISIPRELPDIAKTMEAKQLSGVVPYNFRDGNPTALDRKPKWDLPEFMRKRHRIQRIAVVVGSLVVAVLAYGVYRRFVR